MNLSEIIEWVSLASSIVSLGMSFVTIYYHHKQTSGLEKQYEEIKKQTDALQEQVSIMKIRPKLKWYGDNAIGVWDLLEGELEVSLMITSEINEEGFVAPAENVVASAKVYVCYEDGTAVDTLTKAFSVDQHESANINTERKVTFKLGRSNVTYTYYGEYIQTDEIPILLPFRLSLKNKEYLNDVYNNVPAEIAVFRALKGDNGKIYLLVLNRKWKKIIEGRAGHSEKNLFSDAGSVKNPIKGRSEGALLLSIDTRSLDEYKWKYLVIDVLVTGSNTQNKLRGALFIDKDSFRNDPVLCLLDAKDSSDKDLCRKINEASNRCTAEEGLSKDVGIIGKARLHFSQAVHVGTERGQDYDHF